MSGSDFFCIQVEVASVLVRYLSGFVDDICGVHEINLSLNRQSNNN